jgi:glycosyltransferase involved in cell wall biosynthesis
MKQIVMIGTDPDTMGGISAVVGVYRSGGMFERFPIEYLSTHRDASSIVKMKCFATAVLRFFMKLLQGRVELAHIHTASRSSFYRKSVFMLAARLFRVPTILHLHGAEFKIFYEQECGPVRRALIRSVFDHAGHVVVLSETWGNWVRGITRNPAVSVIYNPVMLPRPAIQWNARVPGRTLFFGRVGPRKGVNDLLTAAARLKPTCNGLHVHIGGDGEVDKATATAAGMGLKNEVSFLGWVRGEQKARALAEASIYTLPSYNEGLPMSVLEAMAAGLPILSTRVGGIPEAVSDGVEGFLVEPGDVDALTERWRQMLQDEAMLRRMGDAARRKVETTFAAEAILPKIENLYRTLGKATS